MNITIISLRGPTNQDVKGGAREYIKDMAKPWVTSGHSVILICGKEKGYNLPLREVVDGIQVYRVGFEKTSFLSIWTFYKKHFEKITDFLVENMVSFPMLSPFISHQKKSITVVHHLTGKEYFNSHKFPKSIVGYCLEEYIIPLVYKRKKIITVSDLTKRELNRLGISDNNISIIPPGINNEYFIPGVKSATPLIVYIGRYDGSNGVKKVDHLIQSFRSIQDEIPQAKMIIAGPNKHEAELQKLSEGLNVELLGFISEEEKRELYQKAWLFASPSYREGFGITMVEANACGTPVVGYQIPGLDTISDEAGQFVESGNIEELTNAIKEILMNGQKRIGMEVGSVRNAQRHSHKAFERKSVEIIN